MAFHDAARATPRARRRARTRRRARRAARERRDRPIRVALGGARRRAEARRATMSRCALAAAAGTTARAATRRDATRRARATRDGLGRRGRRERRAATDAVNDGAEASARRDDGERGNRGGGLEGPRAGEGRDRRRARREIQEAIGACERAFDVLEIVGRRGEAFNAVNSVTAMYKISRLLTSRAGRLRRSEAKQVSADARFSRLLEMVEGGVQQLDKVGLEHRRWAYHKMALPSEYRMKAALSIRLLDRAKDLQGDLMDASDVEFILTMVEEQEEVFNKVNASTALHRVARLTTQRLPGQLRPTMERSTLFGDERFQTLMSMVDRMAGEMSMQGVSNVLWALARLDYPTDEALLEALAARAGSQAASAEPKNLSTTLWALAVLGHKPRSKLLKSISERALAVAHDFRSPDVVNMLWAYARWVRYLPPSDRPTPVVQAMLDQAVSTMQSYTPYQLANLSWSLAMLDCPPAPRVLEYVLQTVASEPSKLDGTALTHVLWAYGVMGSPHNGASSDFSKLLRESGRRAGASQVGRTGAAGVLWACGRLGVEPDAKDTAFLVDRIYSQKGSQKTVDPQALVHSVWGVSTFENYSFDEKTKKEVIRNLSELVSAGSIGSVHANALRDSAEDAGISLESLEKVLPARESIF
jgi:hypothetical protein